MQELINQWLFDPAVGKIVASLVVVLATIIVVRFTQGALGRYIDNSERRYRMRKLVTFAGYILAIFLLSIVFSDKLSGLTVFFGVAGAGIAFALQEVIVSIAGWVVLSFSKLYNVGERVQLGGVVGDVIDIGVLRTTLMECGSWINGDLYNGRVVRVSNSFIFKDAVFNYSSDFPFLWDEITVSLRYGSQYEVARTEFLSILEDITGEHVQRLKGEWRKMTDQYMVENARLEPMVTLSLKGDSVEYALRYVVDYKQRRITRDKISTRILAFLATSGNEVSLSSSSFDVSSVPPIEVTLNSK